jgi:hypothetical protein
MATSGPSRMAFRFDAADASSKAPRFDVMKGIVKIPFSTIAFWAFIVKNGIKFFTNIKNVDETPQHFKGDFYLLHAYFHDIGNKLSADNSRIQFELRQARSNASSSDIIIGLEQELAQIQKNWTQAFADGWMSDEFILFNLKN